MVLCAMYFSFCASYASETILLINLNPCNDGQSTADRLVSITGGRHLVANYFFKKERRRYDDDGSVRCLLLLDVTKGTTII